MHTYTQLKVTKHSAYLSELIAELSPPTWGEKVVKWIKWLAGVGRIEA